MEEFKFEKEMTPIVRRFMVATGYIVRHELVFAHNCDLVGLMFRRTAIKERIQCRQKTPLREKTLIQMELDNEPRSWMPLYDSIIAVELKLSRITEVIEQARGHRRYTNRSYIAMPFEQAYRAIEKAKTANVGVLGVENKGIRNLHNPRTIEIESVWQSHKIAETFWRYHRKEI